MHYLLLLQFSLVNWSIYYIHLKHKDHYFTRPNTKCYISGDTFRDVLCPIKYYYHSQQCNWSQFRVCVVLVFYCATTGSSTSKWRQWCCYQISCGHFWIKIQHNELMGKIASEQSSNNSVSYILEHFINPSRPDSGTGSVCYNSFNTTPPPHPPPTHTHTSCAADSHLGTCMVSSRLGTCMASSARGAHG